VSTLLEVITLSILKILDKRIKLCLFGFWNQGLLTLLMRMRA
jgi:hypothetical protein